MMNKYCNIVLFVASLWMVAIGLRFILMDNISDPVVIDDVERVIGNKQIYANNWFDKIFDWGMLFLFGIFLFIYSVYSYFNNFNKYRCKKIVLYWKGEKDGKRVR